MNTFKSKLVWSVFGVVLSLLITNLALPRVQNYFFGPTPVPMGTAVEDGDLVTVVRRFVCGAASEDPPVGARPQGHYCVAHLVIENVGTSSRGIGGQMKLVAGGQEFPVISKRGPAFSQLVFPAATKTGEAAFDVPPHVTTGTLYLDLAGDGESAPVDVGPGSNPNVQALPP